MTCVRAAGAGSPIADTIVVNWAQDIVIRPSAIYQPTTIDELVAIVMESEARNLAVHAVRSAWSFNDNFATPGFSSGTGSEPGIMVRTEGLHRILSNTMGAVVPGTLDPSPQDPVFQALTSAAMSQPLVHVEVGVKVHDLHDRLEAMSVVKGVPMPHGFALLTLGGSGGQSLAGVVSTSTHGGDVNLPPLPDMVQGIHLVAAGGVEFFLQRSGSRAIVDPNRLAQFMPCVAGRIISDDDTFNAVLCAMGRIGIIYSFVITVRPQFVLDEKRSKASWDAMSSNVLVGGVVTGTPTTIGEIRSNPANRFLQVVVMPYPNASGSFDHDCYVTTRSEQPITAALMPAPSKDLFALACEQQSVNQSLTVLAIMATLGTAAVTASVFAAAVSWIPVVNVAAATAAALALAAATTASTALTPLLAPSFALGDYVATVTNVMTQYGLFDLATTTVNTMLSNGLAPHHVIDLSHKIMDGYDYSGMCYRARSLEVAFDADDTAYVSYVFRLLAIIDDFKARGILYGGYISLRYCAQSEALLAIERWPHTVCIEMSSLTGLDSDKDVLNAFEAAAAQAGAAIHWGQLNNRVQADIEQTFATTITRWRLALAQLSEGGKISTFDNDFCIRRGLEVTLHRHP